MTKIKLLILTIMFSLIAACENKSIEDAVELTEKDTTPPVITLNGESTMTLVQGTAYVEAGASANDNINGNVNVSITGTVDVNTPNTYAITYTSTDSANNSSTVTRTVIIVTFDTTPPVITLNGESTMTLVQGTAYVEAGASANDNIDGNVNVSITGTVDVNTPNTYTINYTSIDSANNSSTVARTVIIVMLDTTPPVITLNGASTVTLVQGAVYEEFGAIAIDDVDGAVNVTMTGAVDSNIPGNYIITYMAMDSASNNATVTRTIIVEAGSNTGQATLTWSAPALNEDNSTLDDLAGYRIFWGNVTGEYPNAVTNLNPDLTTYTINNLSTGNYFFALQALDTSGNASQFSNELTITVE